MTTLPPPSAAIRAVAAPRPDAPPVMRNTLFLICIRCSPAEYGYSLRKNADLEDNSTCMRLAFDLSFADLYEREGLQRVDAAFLGFLRKANDGLHARVLAARGNFAQLKAREESDLLVELAPHVEDFLAKLFGIEAEARALAEKHNELAPIFSVKRLFVQRRAMHKVKLEDANPDGFDFTTELDFARKVTDWQKDEAANADKLEAAARYAAWAALTPQGKAKHRHGVLFKAPRKLDFMRLVPVSTDAS